MATKSFTTDLVVDSAAADDLIAVLASANDVDRQAFVTAETVTDWDVIKTMFRSKQLIVKTATLCYNNNS